MQVIFPWMSEIPDCIQPRKECELEDRTEKITYNAADRDTEMEKNGNEFKRYER